MNPETLRKWAEAERGVASDMRRTELVDDLDAAADAWGADKAQLEEDATIILDTSWQALELMRENDTLRKRLEEREGVRR